MARRAATPKLWVLGFLFTCSCVSWTSNGDTNTNDLNALQAMKDGWEPKTLLGWTGNDPCGPNKWKGISCDGTTNASQRVLNLVLTGLGLTGILPVDISLLTSLQTLDLSFNNLAGQIPPQLGQLTSLTNLALQSNSFTGTIPPELGKLEKLLSLSLNSNSLKGQIPHELGLLKSLYWLDLAFNQLIGPLPYSSDGLNQVNAGLDNLTSAGHFHLNNNNLNGDIPGAICHSNMSLIHLLLDSNQLSGMIPAEIGLCSNLDILQLDNNKLRGNIPRNISQLVKLSGLQLGSNLLSGAVPNLSTLNGLQVLGLQNNPFDNTVFPSWVASLNVLTSLDLRNTNLMGQIPASLFALPSLETVKLDNNSINGTLDLSIASNQLLLVSVKRNSIQKLNQGQYSHNLQLQDNPICTNGFTNLASKVCSAAPSPSTCTDSISISCSNTCSSGSTMVSPLDCSCVVPFKGTFVFRAPSFTTTSNCSRIYTIIPPLATRLNVNTRQIEDSSHFNDQNQLFIATMIFPVGKVYWSSDDVLRMSSALSKFNDSPGWFGPPLFEQDPYPFPVNTFGTGLSLSAKIGIAVGAAVLVLAVLAVCCFAMLQKRRADKAVELNNPFASWGPSGGDSGDAPKLKGARWFSYAELKKATNNFSESNEIGSGGYGKVYRGILVTGEQVAIKSAQKNSLQGATEFKNEIELLSRVHHKNVVSLIGFCFEQGEQMLVYEYMANGSLRESLIGRTGVKMDWQRRLAIALGSARGIAYLHELVTPPIIHRDIKSTNILLDAKKVAKVADFGLSKIGPGEGSGKGHVSTQVKGTLGYLDPEYYLSQQLTEKSDVYSYGVVLLELITARKPIERGKYIVREMKTVLEKAGISGLRTMLDPRMKDENIGELEKFVGIAMACLEESAANRPTMGEVVKKLEELLGHDYPESGSSNMIEVDMESRSHPYGPDSDFLHTSRDSSSDPSFQYSGGFVPPSYEPK